MVRMRSPVQIRLAAPHSRKASLATPRKFLRGVCVFTPPKILSAGTPYVPAAVFPQKVNARRSLAPRFLTLLENYPPLTHFPFAGWAAYAAFFSQGIMSNTPQKFAGCPRFYPTENTFGGDPEIYPTRKIKDFSRGDPEAPLRENYPPLTHFPLAG